MEKQFKCPHCKKSIDRLIKFGEATMIHKLSIGTNNTPEETIVIKRKNAYDLWECPNCGEIVAQKKFDAIQFLMTGKITK